MVEKETGTVEGIVWIGIGFVICLLALRFDLGSFHQPGPGFVALLTGIFVAAMGLAMAIARSVHMRRPQQSVSAEHFQIGAWPRLVYTLVLLLAYIILIEPAGFLLTTFLLMFGLFFDLEKKNYFWSLFFSVVTALVSYLVFEVWLHCQLPRGILPWW
ncbi:MAG TPA: tripartite tricarboxylate transporter TctB family protein [Syntrophorhabdales bacterium]|nr:tripartite tricarboxylate transporter TctB family protein [Syntrophorhabdales bacterium]